MNFLQFFVWGSWLISLGGYMERGLHFEGGQIGAIFATMGIASIMVFATCWEPAACSTLLPPPTIIKCIGPCYSI